MLNEMHPSQRIRPIGFIGINGLYLESIDRLLNHDEAAFYNSEKGGGWDNVGLCPIFNMVESDTDLVVKRTRDADCNLPSAVMIPVVFVLAEKIAEQCKKCQQKGCRLAGAEFSVE